MNRITRSKIVIALGLLLVGCAFSVAPTNSEDRRIKLSLSAFPDRIAVEDSTATAEIWATVRQGDRPVKDSTMVVFATTVGTITPISLTQDGLAVAILVGPGDGRARRAEVIAQTLTVRDTLDVDFVLFDN
tara:strand:- start:566 stop:958 length:393 start_codon:yes stop_codon:yes gene_type:complete